MMSHTVIPLDSLELRNDLITRLGGLSETMRGVLLSGLPHSVVCLKLESFQACLDALDPHNPVSDPSDFWGAYVTGLKILKEASWWDEYMAQKGLI